MESYRQEDFSETSAVHKGEFRNFLNLGVAKVYTLKQSATVACMLFFPRVRTPCGHGAQVIVEGREKQSDGGENNKDHNNNPKTTTKGPQAESPPSCSLSSVLGETGETRKSV